MHKRILKIWIDPPHGNEKSDKNEVYVYIYTHTINITEGSLKMRLDFTHFFFTDHYTCKNPDQSFRFTSLIFNQTTTVLLGGFFSFVIIKKKVNRINLSKLREIS